MSFVNLIKKSAIMKKPMKKIVEIKNNLLTFAINAAAPEQGAPAADQ